MRVCIWQPEQGLAGLQRHLEKVFPAHKQLIKDYDEVTEKLSLLMPEKQALARQIAALAAQIDGAKVAAAEGKAEAKSLEDKLVAAVHARDTLQHNLEAAMPQLQTAQAKCAKLQEEVAQRECEVEALRAEVRGLEVQVGELRQEVAVATSSNSALSMESKAARGKVAQLEGEVERQKQASADGRVRTAALEAEVASLQESLRAKRAEAYQREEAMQAAEAEARRLQGRLDAALAAADKCRAELEELCAGNIKLLKQVNSLVDLGRSLEAAVANRQSGDGAKAGVPSELVGAPLNVAVESLLSSMPEASTASRHLHKEIARLTAKLQEESAACKKEQVELSEICAITSVGLHEVSMTLTLPEQVILREAGEKHAFEIDEVKMRLVSAEKHAGEE